MEAEIFVFVLFLIAILFILPIIIIVQISSLKSEIRYLNRRINDLFMSKPVVKADTETVKPEVKPVEVYQPWIHSTSNLPEESSSPEIIPEPAQHSVSVNDVEMNETENEEKDIPVFSMPQEPVAAFSEPVIPSEPMPFPMYERAYTPPPVSKHMDERNVFGKLLGTNWLSKIGIITLVLGIGFFVKYAIDQDWINEIGRVGIGLFTGGLIIGIAHKLKAKYHVFSSILVGGGISVFYITITIAFREYELFSQTLAFIMLIATTVFSVLLSLLYGRKELAVFSLLGGFASPLMVSTGAGNYIVLFSYILILNTGMLVVSYMKKWRVIGIISYVLTLLFFWVWIISSYKNQFFNVSLFVSLFFVQFYLLALFDHFKSGKKISVYQVFLILTNNLSAFAAYIYVFDDYPSDIRGIITILLAVVNAVVMVTLFRNSRIDRNLVYLIVAIVLSFVSLAIPIQLRGHVITMFWAAEAVILLWLWQKSQIKVFYIGFILIFLLTVFSYLMDVNNLYSYSYDMPIVFNRLFITGLTVLASFVVSLFLLKREPVESGKGTPFVSLFKIIIMLFAYIVPVLELNIQLAHYTDVDYYGFSSFRYVSLATFTTIYIAVLGVIYSRKILSKGYIFGLLYSAVCLYAVFFSNLIIGLRYDIFYFSEETYPTGYFAVHLLSLFAIAYIVYLLVKHIKSYAQVSVWLSWFLTILVVVILSVETDNIIVWMFSHPENYYDVLYDVHTFGYPILWGIIAMVLMVWGLNGKDALLRRISLVFFALIIVKFYAYDVWKMSQAGRIISFVLLGVILLLVSFLQQKIRILVKDDKSREGEIEEKRTHLAEDTENEEQQMLDS